MPNVIKIQLNFFINNLKITLSNNLPSWLFLFNNDFLIDFSSCKFSLTADVLGRLLVIVVMEIWKSTRQQNLSNIKIAAVIQHPVDNHKHTIDVSIHLKTGQWILSSWKWIVKESITPVQLWNKIYIKKYSID